MKKKIIKNLEINNYSNEKLGMLLALLSTFCGSFGSFYTKLIQRTYPNDFHVVQFLFLRCFTLFFLTLFHCKITGQKINKLSEIPHKGWFFMRTNANFFGVACITMSLWYLRASTAIIIQNIHPIIVLNEKRANEKNINANISYSGTFIGLFFAFIDIFFISSVKISNKILVNAKVNIATQMFYVSLSTLTYSSIYTLFFGGVVLKPGYLLMCLVHGIFFYCGNVIYNKALQLAPLSKLILIQYTNVIFIFILAFLFLHEKIFLTDILGAAIMMSYMFYNSYFPVSSK